MPAEEPTALEPIEDKKISDRYLRYALDLHESIACGVVGTDHLFSASMVNLDLGANQLELEIPQEIFASLTHEAIASLDGKGARLRLSYSVNEVLLFLHGKITERSLRRLRVKLELPLLKLQRREALRIKVMLSHQAAIKISGRNLPLFDISASGLGLAVNTADLTDYPVGRQLVGELKFAGITAMVTLKIANHTRSNKDEDRWKVGFRFMGLPPAIEQKIAQQAYLQTQQIWSRWL